MNDNEIITLLGGQTSVARQLSIEPSRVGNWLKRGIPWAFRAKVAKLAKAKIADAAFPADFLENRNTPPSEVA